MLLVLHRQWRRWIERRGLAAAVDRPALRPVWIALTFLLVTIGWIPFRAPDFAATWATLRACATIPDIQLALQHPGIVATPLLALAFCAYDRDRRFQDWLVHGARFRVAVTAGVIAIMALELFGRIDQQIAFVYFQF